MRVLILIAALVGSGCQHTEETPEASVVEPLNQSHPEKAKNPAVSGPISGSASGVGQAPHANDMELKLAKLWARVDELENLHIQQKERMKLIEKGLLLGIIPDELKGKPKASLAGSSPKAAVEAAEEADQGGPSPAEPKPSPSEKSHDMPEYRRLLQAAQEKFNAAQYGQAIVHFNAIGDKFDDSITEGSHHYWIGLSWYYLKEYQLAEQSFKSLKEKFAQNPWVAHSRFYQAKIDQVRGLSKRALEQFTQLMEEFASQDLGEMARMEVNRIREKL